MKIGHLRITKRIPKSCYDCYRRRVKCNKQIPCDVCIKRGVQDTCRRERVVVNGKIVNGEEEQNVLEFKNELLEKENKYLKAKLERYETSQPTQMKKSNEFRYYGMAVAMITRNKIPSDDNVEFDYSMFRSLSNYLTFDVSYQLIKFNLDKICFLHGVILPEIFLHEHEKFFKDDGVHLNNNIEKPRGTYLWLSIYYALISNSLFLLQDTVMEKIDLNEEECYQYGEIAGFASIECLNRGQWLKYPNIKSLQTFCILATSFCSNSGVNIQSVLLSSMIYIAKTLNLDKLVQPTKDLDLLNFELSCRIWFILVIIDWFEDSTANRPSIIGINDFSTPLPRNISDFNLMNSIDKDTDRFLPVTYNLFIYELSKIKKQYYFDNMLASTDSDLECLKFAYFKMVRLEEQISRYNMKTCTPFIKFVLNLKFMHEKLVVSKQIITLKMNNKEDINEERELCTSNSFNLINEFNNLSYPTFFKKYWLVSEHSINGSIFLLIDMILHRDLVNLAQIKCIENFVLNLEVFLKLNNNPISNGIVVIKKLMEVLGRKMSKQNFKLELIEVNHILNTLNNFQKVYDYESNRLTTFLNDSYWNEFLTWINTGDLNG